MATEQDVRELIAAGDEALADAAFRTGDFGKARELLEAAHAEAARGADASGQASALDALGMLAHYENITKLMGGSAVSEAEIAAEERLFRRALACWQEVGEPPDSAQSLFGLGLVYQVLHSDWTTAMPYYWQALGLVTGQEAAGPYLRSEVHRHVGFYFLIEASQPAEAVRHLQISLDLREELGDPRRVPSGLVALAQAELEAGGRERAIELLRRAVAESREAGLLLAWVENAERALAEAEAEGDTAAGPASGPPPDEAEPEAGAGPASGAPQDEADADANAGPASGPPQDEADGDTAAGPASGPPQDEPEAEPSAAEGDANPE
jgi:tetratricopeptide (TPR) repeat protein